MMLLFIRGWDLSGWGWGAYGVTESVLIRTAHRLRGTAWMFGRWLNVKMRWPFLCQGGSFPAELSIFMFCGTVDRLP